MLHSRCTISSNSGWRFGSPEASARTILDDWQRMATGRTFSMRPTTSRIPSAATSTFITGASCGNRQNRLLRRAGRQGRGPHCGSDFRIHLPPMTRYDSANTSLRYRFLQRRGPNGAVSDIEFCQNKIALERLNLDGKSSSPARMDGDILVLYARRRIPHCSVTAQVNNHYVWRP